MRNNCYGNTFYDTRIVMKFYDRTLEIVKLRKIEEQSKSSAQFTIVSGRRRIGKTCLVKEAYKDLPLVYFFVARKAEPELCSTFIDALKETLDIPIPEGSVTNFAAVFKYVMELAQKQHITIMIDEFQEFYNINSSIYSDMQNIWDQYKATASINLIVCGSANSLLNKIFRDAKEPLYGRHTDQMHIGVFPPSVLKEILSDYNPSYTSEDLLALYAFTGGVAKYVEMMMDKGNTTYQKMLDSIFMPDSYFLGEGTNMLIEEFGKEYSTYFSILSLIAQGYNTRGEMEDMLNCGLGGYLKKLMTDYQLINKMQPLFEKAANKNVHYEIGDCFLRFWFRFVNKYAHIIEAGSIDRLKTIVERDYPTFSGKTLEQYFLASFKEAGTYTRLGYWHDRKGNNEIDIVAEDEFEQKVVFYEVKRQAKNIDTAILRAKADIFFQNTKQCKNYETSFAGLSMEDM